MWCLSIKQPWISLILTGHKDVENRTWAVTHTGPLLLHAGKKVDQTSPFAPREPSATGAILGMVTLDRCSTLRSSGWHEINPDTGQPFVGWYMMDPIVFTNPIPYRGRLGLFAVDDAVVKEATP